MSNLTISLLITVVGMGLVFASILLFWLLMAVLVRFAGGPRAQGERAAPGRQGADQSETASLELKRRAALAAVSVALALQIQEQPQPFPMPPTVLVTAWQAVNRSRLHGRRGPVR